MQGKQIHIVFQVLNFLHGKESVPFKITDTEWKLLINLSSHQGKKGIFPSIDTIAKEIKNTTRNIYKVISSLEQKGLLIVTRNGGKSNNYLLCIPVSTPVCGDTPVLTDTPVSPDRSPLSLETLTPVPRDTLYNKEELSNNKEKDITNVISKKVDLPDWLDKKDWNDFLEHRKALKAPMSTIAQNRALTELKKLKDKGENVSGVINQSIVNGWKGLFPVRDNSKNGNAYGNKRQSNSSILFESCKDSLKGTRYDPDIVYDSSEDPFSSKAH